MRSFPLIIVVAGLLFWLAPASAWAQRLQCHPCAYDFGKVQVDHSKSYSIELTNTGDRMLRITSKSEKGSGFSFGAFPVPAWIKPGESLKLPVIFTPTADRDARGTLTLASNDPRSPLEILVSGIGVADSNPQLGVSPATLSFGNVTVGSSASLQATLTASNAAVTITSDGSSSSEFAILDLKLPATLPAGKSVVVTIQFTPNASGTADGKAGFISNAEGSPTVEQLTGVGVAKTSHNVSLTWEPGDDDAVGYNVFRGTAKTGPFEQINTALDSSTNYTDYTVVAGDTYYYVATEVDAKGDESAYSNVAQAVIP